MNAREGPPNSYEIQLLREIVGGHLEGNGYIHGSIRTIYYDTRRIVDGHDALFVALKGHRDGHHYIADAFDHGIRAFLVSDLHQLRALPAYIQTKSAFVVVPDTLTALQQWSRHHRQQFKGTVVGITGSNGKTIVKEWLYHLTGPYISSYRSPGSYNSQLGVPLSILGLRTYHRLAHIEAGISRPGEMTILQQIIQPEGGIFTTLGDAHDSYFATPTDKLHEKLELFRHADWLVYRGDRPYACIIRDFCRRQHIESIEWHSDRLRPYRVQWEIRPRQSLLKVTIGNQSALFTIPFASSHAIENAAHAIVAAHHLGISFDHIAALTASFPQVRMRLEVEPAKGGGLLINDAYSADLTSLKAAVSFMQTHGSDHPPALIISDFEETHPTPSQLQEALAPIKWHHIYHVGKGDAFDKLLPGRTIHVPDVDTLLQHLQHHPIGPHLWLIKGARRTRLEKVAMWLRKQSHPTRLEINLAALAHNFYVYHSLLPRSTEIILMLKSFGYGTGLPHLSRFLNGLPLGWVAVAYIDEGIELRQSGMHHRIMVMNPEGGDLRQLVEYHLEPVVFSMHLWDELLQAGYEGPIHIKLDTGMRRVGFEEAHLPAIVSRIRETPQWVIASVFSHLAVAEDPHHDQFTHRQFQQFEAWSNYLRHHISNDFIRHILNSAGTARFADRYAYDAVRLGIGLLGIDPAGIMNSRLEPALAFKTYVLDVRTVKKGETIGYGRAGHMERDGQVAVIGAGYGDGYRRVLSHGRGIVNINGQLFPTIGNICMDVTLVDVSNGNVQPGDEVVLFGSTPSLNEVARRAETIPYEIITGIPHRVRRLYYLESS